MGETEIMKKFNREQAADHLENVPFGHFVPISAGITHRGHEVDANELVNMAMGPLWHADDGDLSEVMAVKKALENIRDSYPEWFGEELGDMVVSDDHLTVADLSDEYWGENLASNQISVDSTEAKYAVAIPVAAYVCREMWDSHGADLHARREHTKEVLRREIADKLHEQPISQDDVTELLNDTAELVEGH